MNDDRDALDYERWILLVDEALRRMIGVGVTDLPDFRYHDAWTDYRGALDVAREVVQRTEQGDI